MEWLLIQDAARTARNDWARYKERGGSWEGSPTHRRRAAAAAQVVRSYARIACMPDTRALNRAQGLYQHDGDPRDV